MSLQDLPSQIFADAEVRVGRVLAIQAEIARLQEMADRFEGETRTILSKIGGADLVDALYTAVADRVAGHPLVTLGELAPRAPTAAPVAAATVPPVSAPAAQLVVPAPRVPVMPPAPPRVVEAPEAEQIVDLGDERLEYFGVPIAKNHLGMAREIVQEAREAVKANDRTGLAKYARRFGRVAWKRHLYFAIWRVECAGFNEAEHLSGDAVVQAGAELAEGAQEQAATTFPDPPFDGEQTAIVSYAEAVGSGSPEEAGEEQIESSTISGAGDIDPVAGEEVEPDLDPSNDDTEASDDQQSVLTDDDLPLEGTTNAIGEPAEEEAADDDVIGDDGVTHDEQPAIQVTEATTVVSLDTPQVAIEVRTSGPGELRLGAPRRPPAAPPMGRPPHAGPRPAPAPVQAQLADDTTFGDPDGAPGFDLAQQPPLFDDALPDFLRTPDAPPTPAPRHATPPGAPRRFAPGL